MSPKYNFKCPCKGSQRTFEIGEDTGKGGSRQCEKEGKIKGVASYGILTVTRGWER